MPTHRRTPSTTYDLADAAQMHSPAWVAMPEDDDEELDKLSNDVVSWSATAWYVMLSMIILVALFFAKAPYWLLGIVAAEVYASLRRVAGQLSGIEGGAAFEKDVRSRPSRQRRLRHFTSLHLVEGAPVDEIVAKFLALDELKMVRIPEQPVPRPLC